MEKKKMDYQNGYIKQKYDRINVTIPKGKKEEYRQTAEAAGMSLNAVINKLLKDWSNATQAQTQDQDQGQDKPQHPTAATKIDTLKFISPKSAEELKTKYGVYTIGEYTEKYYEEDVEDCLTIEEFDNFNKYLDKYELWTD